MKTSNETHWMGRNWKWFVPVGCLTLLVLAAAALAGFFFLIMGAIQNSEVYEVALERARSNPDLVAALGEPITDSMVTSGTISISDNDGEADLKTHIQGPEGGASLIIVARRQNDVWTYEILQAELDDQRGTINLLVE